jgi:hypothetical protein
VRHLFESDFVSMSVAKMWHVKSAISGSFLQFLTLITSSFCRK